MAAAVRVIAGPVVLVGHSYAGAVITQASADLDKVVGLAYVAAVFHAAALLSIAVGLVAVAVA